MGGSLLSMRQNNKGASYFRLEGLSPRLPAGMASPHKPESVPVAPPIALSFELSTELYGQLDDLVRFKSVRRHSRRFGIFLPLCVHPHLLLAPCALSSVVHRLTDVFRPMGTCRNAGRGLRTRLKVLWSPKSKKRSVHPSMWSHSAVMYVIAYLCPIANVIAQY